MLSRHLFAKESNESLRYGRAAKVLHIAQGRQLFEMITPRESLLSAGEIMNVHYEPKSKRRRVPEAIKHSTKAT